MKKRRRLWVGISTVISALVVTEIVLRVFFGFGNAVLYREDKDFEYITLPQKTQRFGNHIFFNSYSQRSAEITPQDSIIIDGFGDSVLEGGALVDDDSLATSKLSKYLTNKLGKKVNVLNISCKSWGPDNCFAYLKHYGDFHAKAMFLVMSSHDVFDTMNFKKTVGVNPIYPDRQFRFAISELIIRYVIPTFLKDNSPVPTQKQEIAGDSSLNPGVQNLYEYSRAKKIPFVIYLHAEQNEMARKKYDQVSDLLVNFCRKNSISLIRELDFNLPVEAYRDYIHFSSLGQQKMFEILKDKVYPERQ